MLHGASPCSCWTTDTQWAGRRGRESPAAPCVAMGDQLRGHGAPGAARAGRLAERQSTWGKAAPGGDGGRGLQPRSVLREVDSASPNPSPPPLRNPPDEPASRCRSTGAAVRCNIPGKAPASQLPAPPRPRPQVTFCPGSVGSGAVAMGQRHQHGRPARPGPSRAEAPPLRGPRQRKPRPQGAGRHFRERFCFSAGAALARAISFVRRMGPPSSQRGPPALPARTAGGEARGRLGQRRRTRAVAERGRHLGTAPLPAQPPPSAPTAISNRRPRSCSACSAPTRAAGGGALAAAALSRARPPPGSGLRRPRPLRVLCPSGPRRAPRGPPPPPPPSPSARGAFKERRSGH